MKQEKAMKKLEQDIILRGLADSTRKSYITYTQKFLCYCDKPIDKLNEKHVRMFLSHLKEQHYANQTINGYGSAIRFFFAVTLNRTMNYLQIPRMKVPKHLPPILSREEISMLVKSSANARDKAIILMTYGSGLRVSEVACLQVSDIQSDGMRVFVRESKRGKDRYTILSQNALMALRAYWRIYHINRDEKWLFPGEKDGCHLSVKTVEEAVKTACVNASIRKNITPHVLRHAFATHMLEDGVNLLRLKELLGHSSIQSTAIYLHLANIPDGVVSPADKLAGTGK
jgi:site-specific recombinase XerD